MSGCVLAWGTVIEILGTSSVGGTLVDFRGFCLVSSIIREIVVLIIACIPHRALLELAI